MRRRDGREAFSRCPPHLLPGLRLLPDDFPDNPHLTNLDVGRVGTRRVSNWGVGDDCLEAESPMKWLEPGLVDGTHWVPANF